MSRSPRAPRLIALVTAAILMVGCTPTTEQSQESPSPAVEQSASTSSATPTPTPKPTPTVPPVDAALLAEAIAVFEKATIRIRTVSTRGGFPQDRVDSEYLKYMMGGDLLNAIMQATGWNEDGKRRVKGTEELLNVRHYPVMASGSLIALTGCRSQKDVRIENAEGLGWPGSNEQLIVYLKRDSDGLLKIFDRDFLQVDSCDPTSAAPALVTEATTIFTTVFGLFEKHLGAGGLSYANYPTSGFGPYLGGEARNRILWELEHFRLSTNRFSVTGPPVPVSTLPWPRSLDKSVVAITGCFARSNMVYINNGVSFPQGPRIYFAHFTHDKAGKLRMTALDWIYVDACS